MSNHRKENSASAHKNLHHKNKGSRYVFPLFVCFLGGFFTLFFLLLLGAWAVSRSDHPILLIGFAVTSLLLAVVVLGRLIGKAFPQERGFMGLIGGILCSLLLVGGNLLFFGQPVTMQSLAKYLLLPFVTMGVAFTGSIQGRKRKRSH